MLFLWASIPTELRFFFFTACFFALISKLNFFFEQQKLKVWVKNRSSFLPCRRLNFQIASSPERRKNKWASSCYGSTNESVSVRKVWSSSVSCCLSSRVPRGISLAGVRPRVTNSSSESSLYMVGPSFVCRSVNGHDSLRVATEEDRSPLGLQTHRPWLNKKVSC